MKILYISPENTVGVLSVWQRAHREAGNECRFVTFYPSWAGYEEDICLNLPLISTKSWFTKTRNKIYQQSRGKLGDQTEKRGNPPIWRPENAFQKMFFSFRDWLWKFKIEPAVREYNLTDFDVFHFEWGLDFYRHSGFAKRMKEQGKHIVCHYHGQDMRTRGVISAMDEISDLNLTNEPDLFLRHPKMEYVFLPFDVKSIIPKTRWNEKIKICHATTNRFYKGSEKIIEICEKLENENLCKFVLIENMPHCEAIQKKSECDINIDQITEVGGWGWGMNSVEAMAMGLCCVNFMNSECEKMFPDHPFVNTTAENLEKKLRNLLKNSEQIAELGNRARVWVLKNHHYEIVREKLYEKYRKRGWM